MYSTDRAAITSKTRSVTLEVAVPGCSTQVYAFAGSAVTTEATSTSALYAGAVLGSSSGTGSRSSGPAASYRGGSAECTAAPTVSFANSCDGTFTAALSNRASANTAAVFVRDGRLIRVAPGATVNITVPKSQTLTMRAADFTTYAGTWRPPTTCTAAPAVPAASLPTERAAATRSPGAPAASAVPLSTSADATTPAATAATPNPAYSANPAAQAESRPTTPTVTGMSTGSMLAIALGVLMVVGGIAVLTRVIRSAREPA